MSKQVAKQISGGQRQVNQLKLIRKHWFGGRCMYVEDGEQCDKKRNLELAHAIDTQLSKDVPTERSSWARLKDTLENPECFLLFCLKHHRMFDGRTADLWQKRYVGDIDL